MKRQLIIWASVFAVMLLAFGFLLGAWAGTLLASGQHEEHEATGHSHMLMEYQGEYPPSIRIIAARDSKSGYNIQFVTQNFTFSPEAAGQEHVSGQGHAHLYVNDVKVARPYGEWFYLDAQPGDVVHATLNTNDHMTYAVDGEEVADEITLE